MALSPCAMILVVVATLAASFAAGCIGYALYNKCVQSLKFSPQYTNQFAFGSAVAALLLIATTIGVNTKEWKPCGQDSIAKALQNTPAQPVVASISQNCGCGQ